LRKRSKQNGMISRDVEASRRCMVTLHREGGYPSQGQLGHTCLISVPPRSAIGPCH
jgi:hypothetical protein